MKRWSAAVGKAGLVVMSSVLAFGALQRAEAQTRLPWRGWMRCDVIAQSATYQSRQTHTWMLMSAEPVMRGAIELRPATWSVSGGGWVQTQAGIQSWTISVGPTFAPMSTVVRADDGRRLFQTGHAQLRADNALRFEASNTAGGTAVAGLTVFEWPLPIVEEAPNNLRVVGARRYELTARLDRMQPPDARGMANCEWRFSATEKVPPPPPLAPLPGPSLPRSVQSSPRAAPPIPVTTHPQPGTAGLPPVSAPGRPAARPAPSMPSAQQTPTLEPLPESSTSANRGPRSLDRPVDASRAPTVRASPSTPSAQQNPTLEPAPESSANPNRGPRSLDRSVDLSKVPPPAAPPPGDPGATLSAVKPNGPPPEGFSFSADFYAVQLSWAQPYDYLGTTLRLYRAVGSQTPNEIPLPRGGNFNRQPSSYRDEPLEPGRYTYRLIVTYPNGTWGEAAASHTAPAYKNPTRLRATSVSLDAVKLEWDATPGALRYRVDGTTLPVTGKEVMETTLTISPIRGPGTWQLAAIYPGDRADFSSRPSVSTLSKPIPSHAPTYLSKSNGTGSASEAAAHYMQLCNHPDGGCSTLESYLASWGAERLGSATTPGCCDDARAVKYNNISDLGAPRQTNCFFAQPTANRWPKRTNQGGVICYANSGLSISFIVMNPEGARFAVFQNGDADSSGYGGGWWGASPQPSALFDSEGEKFAPHVCLSCHGGTYDPATQLVKGASLLPIDPSLVQLVGNDPAAQEKIRNINAMIRQTYSSPAIAAYIDGLYGGMDGTRHKVDIPGTQALADYAPPGWHTQRGLYLDFVKKDCAMCHLAGPANLNFLTTGNFLSNRELIHTAVCKARSMPHAETAFINFWTSGAGAVSGPGWFAAALGFPGCP